MTNYNANMFELLNYRPLKTTIYKPTITPDPEIRNYFYQILGKTARIITDELKTAVISEKGLIIILEKEITEDMKKINIELSNVGNYIVNLKKIDEKNISYQEYPREYGKLINQIVDLALVYFSNDYYKYSESSPDILEKGEGYFDESLRKLSGIEDGRKYYRGIKDVQGVPHLLLNREIELRSLENLLNELKILGDVWKSRNHPEKEFDFYDPPLEFIDYINKMFKNRTANVKYYSSRKIKIKEITWEIRADSKILDNNETPIEYHKKIHNISIKDKKQPLIKWDLAKEDGAIIELNHVPELLVVGHNFRDLSRRVSKTRISQIFDILQPNCFDLQRKLYDLIQKIDTVLRKEYSDIYPRKVEFAKTPRDLSGLITNPSKIDILFKDKEIQIEPPYGINFYRKYSKSTKFISPISKDVNLLFISTSEHSEFIKELVNELENRNDIKIIYNTVEKQEVNQDIINYDLVISINDNSDEITEFKNTIFGKYGVPHQNINSSNANSNSIPQLVMQSTLKMGGTPWLIKTENKNYISLYSYTNPFSGVKFYIYNMTDSQGNLKYQSFPYREDKIHDLLEEIKQNSFNEIVILLSYIKPEIKQIIIEQLSNLSDSYIMITVYNYDPLRMFSTYKPSIPYMPIRRRVVKVPLYYIEANEDSPQGLILETSNNEYYAITTASTQVGTYYRGCPNAIKLVIEDMKGVINIQKTINDVIKLSVASATSGHSTKLPAPIYYLKLYAQYVNRYSIPNKAIVNNRLFYV